MKNIFKKLRKEKGLKAKDICLKTGISKVSLSKIENNERSPKVTTALKIAGVLGESLENCFYKD